MISIRIHRCAALVFSENISAHNPFCSSPNRGYLVAKFKAHVIPVIGKQNEVFGPVIVFISIQVMHLLFW